MDCQLTREAHESVVGGGYTAHGGENGRGKVHAEEDGEDEGGAVLSGGEHAQNRAGLRKSRRCATAETIKPACSRSR